LYFVRSTSYEALLYAVFSNLLYGTHGRVAEGIQDLVGKQEGKSHRIIIIIIIIISWNSALNIDGKILKQIL
jgi:hypothetical protein